MCDSFTSSFLVGEIEYKEQIMKLVKTSFCGTDCRRQIWLERENFQRKT